MIPYVFQVFLKWVEFEIEMHIKTALWPVQQPVFRAYQNSYVTCAIASFQRYIVISSRKHQNVVKKKKKKTPFGYITLKEKDPAHAGPSIGCPESSLLWKDRAPRSLHCIKSRKTIIPFLQGKRNLNWQECGF